MKAELFLVQSNCQFGVEKSRFPKFLKDSVPHVCSYLGFLTYFLFFTSNVEMYIRILTN